MKDQALNGAGLADRIERLGEPRPTPTWVSRRLGAAAISGQGGHSPDGEGVPQVTPLIRVNDDLFVIARALEVDHDTLTAMVVDAVLGSEKANA
jgi:hypothetical protein